METAIESLSASQSELAINFNLTSTTIASYTIHFIISTQNNSSWNPNDQVQLVCVFLYDPNQRI